MNLLRNSFFLNSDGGITKIDPASNKQDKVVINGEMIVDLAREKAFVKERNEKLKNFGKVTVSKSTPKGDVQDVDYEEVN